MKLLGKHILTSFGKVHILNRFRNDSMRDPFHPISAVLGQVPLPSRYTREIGEPKEQLE